MLTMPRTQFSLRSLFWLTLAAGLWLACFSTVRGEPFYFRVIMGGCITAAFAGAGLCIVGACMQVRDDWRRGAAQLGLIAIGAAIMALAGFAWTFLGHAMYAG